MRFVPGSVVAGLLATVALIGTGPGSVPAPATAGDQPPRPARSAPAAELPPDLALVPADALGFVHVRAAELWKRDVFATFRQTFEKAGPKVLAALDQQFVPKISTLDRLTGFLVLDRDDREPLPLLVLRFSEPFDPARVVSAYRTRPETVTIRGRTAYGADEFAFFMPDRQHLVLGPPQAMISYLEHTFPKEGPLSPALKLAASGKPLVASLDISGIPLSAGDLQEIPAEIRPLIRPLLKARHLTAFLDLDKDAVVRFTLGYKTADDAQAAEKAVKALAEFLRKECGRHAGADGEEVPGGEGAAARG